MNCGEYSEDRVRAACGEAPSAAFRDHSASCARCGEEVAEFREIRRIYREASSERMSPPAVERLRALRPSARRLPAVRPLSAVAAILMTALLWMLLIADRAGADLSWEPTRRVAELGELNLDEQIRYERARAESAAASPSDVDLEIDDLKRRCERLSADSSNL